MRLGECVQTASENIELVRKVVLSMIMRILDVGEEGQALVLGQSGTAAASPSGMPSLASP
jgi:hypothetical protein